MNEIDWLAGAKEVPAPEPKRKQCEAENCVDFFEVKWPKQRRCEKCRRLNKPYRKNDSPF